MGLNSGTEKMTCILLDWCVHLFISLFTFPSADYAWGTLVEVSDSLN